jgi:hypothetical protein
LDLAQLSRQRDRFDHLYLNRPALRLLGSPEMNRLSATAPAGNAPLARDGEDHLRTGYMQVDQKKSHRQCQNFPWDRPFRFRCPSLHLLP